MIKYTEQKVIEVNDWDDLVQKTYDKSYNFQQQDGCKDRGMYYLTIPSEEAYDYNNESILEEINGKEMGVKFNVWLARNPKEWNGDKEDKGFVNMFWERNFYPEIQTVANNLHKKGLIEAGDYIINIDW